MTQPYSAHQMQSGTVPPAGRMGNPTPEPPAAECQAAVDASIDADDYSVQHAPRQAVPGLSGSTG